MLNAGRGGWVSCVALSALCTGWTAQRAAAQSDWVGGGYIVYEEIDLPAQVVETEATDLPQNPNRMDVKAIGMGRTQAANGHAFNAMMDNPALLAHRRFTIDLVGMQAGIPQATLDAARFIKDNQVEFTDGDFFTLIRDGYEAYEDASTLQEKRDAIAMIRQGFVFPNELLKETVGRQDDPNTHGVNVIPNVQVQWGHFGASLYGTGQVGFEVTPGNSIDQLLSVEIPQDANHLDGEAMRTLSRVIGSLFEEDGTLAKEGLPQAFAITYVDAVGAVGYAHSVRPDLDVGANLKVIHRRFSTKNIDSENLDAVLDEALDELDESVTGVTLDVGALYTYAPTGTAFGATVQNLLPVKKIGSAARFSFVEAAEYYLTDAAGQPLVGVLDRQGEFRPWAGGDTLLSVQNAHLDVHAPFQLKAPLMLNLGVCHPLAPHWDASLDWVDVLAQDDKFASYQGRFRVGTEVRLLKEVLALRGGVADEHLTAGLGLDLRVLQLDTAYAYDNFVGDNTYYLQLKLGW
ncbi:MAG: hypothetical protein AB1505_20685 [Candidatus Latescibacterota bacterium]